ncbi:MAG: chemotaxis protein CheB [Variovorax sp.]
MQNEALANGRCDLIVVGGWRGSLEALGRIASALPANFPAAVLAVLHDDPHTHRLIKAVVGRRTPLPIGYAIHGEEVRPGRIYVSPPDHCLTVTMSGTIALEPASPGQNSLHLVDRLFQSAGAAYGARVIAVVLTGDGHDGTEGMQSLTVAGGIRIVQSPADAVASSMPSSAVLGDHPDFVVLVQDIGNLLMRLVAPASAPVNP